MKKCAEVVGYVDGPVPCDLLLPCPVHGSFGRTPSIFADAVMGVLRDPAHRDELLALLLDPDESVRKDGEMRLPGLKSLGLPPAVYRVTSASGSGLVPVSLAPVSGAELAARSDDRSEEP